MDEFGGGGVVTRKLCVQRGATLALCSFHQLSPQVRVGRDLRDVPSLYERPHILTRPTDDDWRLSTSVNVIDGAGSGIKKPPQREIIIGLGESVQVMRHAAALVLTWNTRADVKPAIDLPTVRVDDLAVYLPREPDGDSRLPDRSRPHDGKDDRLGHGSTRNMGAASGFTRPASSPAYPPTRRPDAWMRQTPPRHRWTAGPLGVSAAGESAPRRPLPIQETALRC